MSLFRNQSLEISYEFHRCGAIAVHSENISVRCPKAGASTVLVPYLSLPCLLMQLHALHKLQPYGIRN